jgi:hypothetical protein
LAVVVYVKQNPEAIELKRGSTISRRQLSGWQSISTGVGTGVLTIMGLVVHLELVQTSVVLAIGVEVLQIPVVLNLLVSIPEAGAFGIWWVV